MEFLARGLRRQAAQGCIQAHGAIPAECGEALSQKSGGSAHPGDRQAGQSRPEYFRIAGARHGPLFIPHCHVRARSIRDRRPPTPEELLKDIQRSQIAQPRDTACQPSRDPRPLKELCIGLQSSQMGPEAMRSEEHTSELQSLAYLVCRLLLEKKKIQAAVTNEVQPMRQHSLR